MISVLKNILSHKTKVKFLLLRLRFKPLNSFNFKISSSKKRIYIFLAADYGNLGDVAITYAQHKFLSETFKDYQVTEIPISSTLAGLEYVRRTINSDDIVTTVGGGNMGDLYDQIENFRKLVVQYFPKNKIISFPQTIDFSSSKLGKKKLQETIEIYTKHKKLLLLAREQKTFDFFQKHFSQNKSLLVPDIVMTVNRDEPLFKREGAVICLRQDKERKLTDVQNVELVEIIKEQYRNITYRDTHIGTSFMSMRVKVKELFAIWDTFKKAEVVVTDRLHGMIFCFITNTPAIVLLNNNHKVESSYEWLKHTTNIKLVKNYSASSIKESLKQIADAPSNEKKDLLAYYKDFVKTVKEL